MHRWPITHKSKEERKIIVTNISPRVTPSQLQSFFSKFGKVSHCSLPREDRRTSMFGTMPKFLKNCGTATLTFKKAEDADRAKNAAPEELKFYDQCMVVAPYVSRRKGTKGVILADESKDETFDLSRASSNQSLASTTMSTSGFETRLARDCEGFGKHNPFRNYHLKSILRRAGVHLKSLDMNGIVHLMDEKALEIIAASCPILEEWEALGDLGESLTNLKRLTYRDMDNASDKAFWFLIKDCGRGLRKKVFPVDLLWMLRLHVVFPIVERTLAGTVIKCRIHRRWLRSLRKKTTHKYEFQLYLDGCVHVDERALEDLCTCAAGLKELRLNDCFQITDENLSMISRMLVDLRVFTLCGDRFDKLSSAGMAHISNMTLDYNALVDDKFLLSICKELKSLKTLSLSNAGTDQTLTAKGLTAIAQLKALEQLDLSSLAALRSGVLLEIVFSCRSITLLQLRNCVYLSDDGIKGLTRIKGLRHVDLSGSILITNDSIQEFIKGFPQVKGENGAVTIVIGGTAADSSRLSMRGSRVVVDLSDYTSILSVSSHRRSNSFRIGTLSDDELSDDDFENLTTQRSFYIDAVCGEEESPIEDVNELQQWVEREARNLGLLEK
ncbi:hypothetical protein COOONC_15174 [Cooperia oncophora]